MNKWELKLVRMLERRKVKRQFTEEKLYRRNKEKRDGLRVSFVLCDCNKMQNVEACLPVLEIWLFSLEI